MLGYNDDFLNEAKGYITAKEISQQPELWKQTLEIIKSNRAEIKEFTSRLLQKKDLRIILTGAGSSAFVGDCAYPYLQRLLKRTVESIPTTSIITNPEDYLFKNTPTLLISYGRSGDSPESVAAVEAAEAVVDELYQIVITCNDQGRLAKKAVSSKNNLLLMMPENANDQGFAMTGSYTTMLLSTLLVFDTDNLDQIENDIKVISQLGEAFINDRMGEIKQIAAEDYSRIFFLGSASLYGLAREAHLKSLELTSGTVMANFESPVAFRHGPKTAITDESIVVAFLSDDKYTQKYEVDLIKELAVEKRHKKLVIVSHYPVKEAEGLADYYLYAAQNEYQYKNDVFLAFYYVLFAQMLAFFKSLSLGVTPDNPCPTGNANRVVKGIIIYPYNQ